MRGGVYGCIFEAARGIRGPVLTNCGGSSEFGFGLGSTLSIGRGVEGGRRELEELVWRGGDRGSCMSGVKGRAFGGC